MQSSEDPAPSQDAAQQLPDAPDHSVAGQHLPDAMQPRQRICIIGASGKLGQYLIQHALDRGYEVVGVCREQSVGKLARFGSRIRVMTGLNDDPHVIREATSGCAAVLTVLVPYGMRQYASGTVRAVLTHAPVGARLIFSCGWHITRDG